MLRKNSFQNERISGTNSFCRNEAWNKLLLLLKIKKKENKQILFFDIREQKSQLI